jgi:hypothetical protein
MLELSTLRRSGAIGIGLRKSLQRMPSGRYSSSRTAGPRLMSDWPRKWHNKALRASHEDSGEIMQRLYAIARELRISSAKALAYCRVAGIETRNALSALSAEDEARLRRFVEENPGMPEPEESWRRESSPGTHGLGRFLKRVACVLLVWPVGLIIWVFGLWEDQNNRWNRFYDWLIDGSSR